MTIAPLTLNKANVPPALSESSADDVGGIVGVLGGMGPLATLDFQRKIFDATPARCDQEHVPLLVSSIPQIPDRTAAFRGSGASPLPALVATGRRLIAAGAAILVMPCHTAHLWFEELQATLDIPMLHIADAALAELSTQAKLTRVGILGTEATLNSELYTKRAHSQLSITWVVPTPCEVKELVMPGIYSVKSGALQTGAPLLRAAGLSLVERGAEAILLACTELPLVINERDVGVAVFDATDALARATVAWSRMRSQLTK